MSLENSPEIKHQAISYSRFSSLKQGKGSSIERQREMFNEWLARNQGSYYESNLSAKDEGLSAYKGKNKEGGLGAILEAIQQGLVRSGDVLVVEAIDRLSRAQAMDALRLLGDIVRAGIPILTLEDNQTYTEESLNGPQLFLLAAKVQGAHEYSKRLGSRVKAAWKVKEEKAKAGDKPKKLQNIPCWVDRETLKLNDLAPAIKQLIDLYLEGEGIREVCYFARESLSFKVAARTFTRWLDSEVLLGHWRGIECFEALLSEKEFFELQRQRKARTRTPKQPNFRPLSGLVVCGKCGGSFNFRIQKPAATIAAPKGSEAYAAKPLIVYGNCRNYLHEKSCSNGATVPEEVAMLVYNATVDRLLFDLAYVAAMDVKSREDLAGIVERRARLETEYNNRESLYIKGIKNSEDDAARLALLKQQLAECDKEISASLDKQQQFESYKEHIQEMRKLLAKGKRLDAVDAVFGWGFAENEDLKKAVEQQIARIEASPFLMRLALKNAGYRIVVDRTKDGRVRLTCKDSDEPGEEWIIQKRSQKLGCYLVENRFFGPVDIEEYSNGDYGFIEGENSRVIEARR
ncbi:site-specific recombinase, DNA invertase Pin [Azospira oryzae PS]|uniref:Site-specific recombinase, DNA invertase Pin n=1 Tax=Azospira oryzae (strain ATCC BAA-33 / DSM 13638 / PS) TaxID=640081 RepID=G8QHN0_AZOOP|nr:recombinase family protein [Azospira oryzae]AEV25181.1 site-specific recombinase, DNA invertase Pin [Azospira oryzae PS]